MRQGTRWWSRGPHVPVAAVAGAGRRRARDDRGEVSILAAGLVPALIIAIGLVVDGGGKLQAEDEAEYVAEQAARAAAQQVGIAALQRGDAPVIDPVAAVTAAQQTLDAAGVVGAVDAVNGATVRVSTEVTYRTKFLPLIGIHELTATATAEARAVRGIGEEAP
ncbi:pilus assembly protein TadG-related protein [Antribacter sp. KLBMP9083]|uniref:Pilus assembly protein TadG-related protein n=1 Tax=Antribacter soli TaxID=2910976 RepID=A0AA41U6G0_9MICO|nr:pilus assembly protein TadG-related protein [Antribacter soli]MCF4120406.1 pilus assembly protein TadG-related protein [Antribacter soli]